VVELVRGAVDCPYLYFRQVDITIPQYLNPKP